MPPTVRGKLNTPWEAAGHVHTGGKLTWDKYYDRFTKIEMLSLSSNPWVLWIWGASPEYRLPPPGCTPSSIDPTVCIRIHSLQRFALEEESRYCYKNQGGVRWDLSPGPLPRIQQSSLEWFGMSSLGVLWSRIRGAVSTDSTLSTHNIPSFQVLGG